MRTQGVDEENAMSKICRLRILYKSKAESKSERLVNHSVGERLRSLIVIVR